MRKDLRYPFRCLFLLLTHQLRPDADLGHNLLDRLFPFQDSTIASSFVNFGHVDECVVFFLSLFYTHPDFCASLEE